MTYYTNKNISHCTLISISKYMASIGNDKIVMSQKILLKLEIIKVLL